MGARVSGEARAGGRQRRHGGGSGDEHPSTDDVGGWLAGRLPDAWFEGPPTVTVDRDEIVVVGRVAAPEVAAIMAPLLGWNRRRRAAEVREYQAFAATNAAALHAPAALGAPSAEELIPA